MKYELKAAPSTLSTESSQVAHMMYQGCTQFLAPRKRTDTKHFNTKSENKNQTFPDKAFYISLQKLNESIYKQKSSLPPTI